MKNIVGNKKGQAIFEFIIFVPFLVFLYTIFYTIGNSINGSITEQKTVRGYFYNLVKGNSYLLTAEDLQKLGENAIKTVGFFSIAEREKEIGETKHFAPCFEFASMIKGASTEECGSGTRAEPGSSSIIRIFTAYGVCGPIYTANPTGPGFSYSPGLQAMAGGCKLGLN